jgi:hypothetical protein
MRCLTPVLIFIAFTAASGPGKADTVTDWDAKAIAAASAVAPLGQREVALVDLAMFEAVNAIEHRYQPYLATPSVAAPVSPDVAAASAAAAMLAALHPEDGTRFKSELAEYLQPLHADCLPSR